MVEPEYIDPTLLPPDHPLRNTILRDLGAEIRSRGSKLWKEFGTWKLGKATFNEVGEVWTSNNEFRIPIR